MAYARHYTFNEVRQRLLDCEGKPSPVTKADAHSISMHGHREIMTSRPEKSKDTAFVHARFEPHLHHSTENFRNFDQLYILLHVLNSQIVQLCLESFDRRMGLYLSPVKHSTVIDFSSKGMFPVDPYADRLIVKLINVDQILPSHIPKLSQRISYHGSDETKIPLNFVTVILDRDPRNLMIPWIQTFYPSG